MKSDEIRFKIKELNAYETAASLAAEIAILQEESKIAAKRAANASIKLNFGAYKRQRENTIWAYQELYVLRDKLREELAKLHNKEGKENEKER